MSGETPGEVITARVVITLEDLTAAWDAFAGKRRKVNAAIALGVVAFFGLWPVLQGEAELAWTVAGAVVFLVTGVALAVILPHSHSLGASDARAVARQKVLNSGWTAKRSASRGLGARVAWSGTSFGVS